MKRPTVSIDALPFCRPVTRCEAVGRPKGSVDPEGVPTTGARGCPPENFLEIQLWNPSFRAIFIIIEFTKS